MKTDRNQQRTLDYLSDGLFIGPGCVAILFLMSGRGYAIYAAPALFALVGAVVWAWEPAPRRQALSLLAALVPLSVSFLPRSSGLLIPALVTTATILFAWTLFKLQRSPSYLDVLIKAGLVAFLVVIRLRYLD